MTPKPDPTTDPALRFCSLLIGWLTRRLAGEEDISEKKLIEQLQSIFRKSDIIGPTRIIQELRQRGDFLNGYKLKYEFTSAGPELDGACIRKIIKRVFKQQERSGKQAKSGSHTNLEEERSCVDT